jgi:hypothetical protein
MDFSKNTTSKYHNTVQNNAKTYIPNIADITNMQHRISKHIPKRFNILTISKTLKRIKRTEKVPGMERKMHKRTK